MTNATEVHYSISMIMISVQQILQELKQKGFRVTKIRTALLSLLLHHNTVPLSAVEIRSQLKQKHTHANKTTIYRELHFLIEQKIIQEVPFKDKRKHFELALREHHHHIQCKKCGWVGDVTREKEIQSIEHYIAKKSKFLVTEHSLQFFGLCQQCQ